MVCLRERSDSLINDELEEGSSVCVCVCVGWVVKGGLLVMQWLISIGGAILRVTE